MCLMLEGNRILFKLMQPVKALGSMVSIPSRSVTLVKFLQSAKARIPMVLTLPGTVTERMRASPSYARGRICAVPKGITGCPITTIDFVFIFYPPPRDFTSVLFISLFVHLYQFISHPKQDISSYFALQKSTKTIDRLLRPYFTIITEMQRNIARTKERDAIPQAIMVFPE